MLMKFDSVTRNNGPSQKEHLEARRDDVITWRQMATTHQYVTLLTTDAVILDIDVRHHAAGALMHVTHVTVVFAVRAAHGATVHVITVVVATFGTLQRHRFHDIMSRFLNPIPPPLPRKSVY